jgi:hypothetical protein
VLQPLRSASGNTKGKRGYILADDNQVSKDKSQKSEIDKDRERQLNMLIA